MLVTTNAYLLLGTNMGDRAALLGRARHEITRHVGQLHGVSSIYETAAWGNNKQPHYLNQVVRVATLLQPLPLLEQINRIEQRMGRVRAGKWESRLIDIDILYYGDEVIDMPNLQVPHPHLPDRRFALVPLHEIAPGLIHPVSRKTTADLLRRTPDQLAVRLFNPETHEQHGV